MEKHELQNLVDEYLSIRKIAQRTGKSVATIRYWLKKHDLSTKKVLHKEDKFVCSKCLNQCKPSDFYMNKKHRHTYCKTCFNAAAIERMRLNKIKAVEYKGGCCERCGYSKYIGALQFHHIDPTKKDPDWFNLKKRSFDEKNKTELDKCMLLCANCHAEVHYEIFNAS